MTQSGHRLRSVPANSPGLPRLNHLTFVPELKTTWAQLAASDDQAFANLESDGFAQNVVRRKSRHSAVVELYDACLHEGELAGQARVTDHIGKHHPC